MALSPALGWAPFAIGADTVTQIFSVRINKCKKGRKHQSYIQVHKGQICQSWSYFVWVTLTLKWSAITFQSSAPCSSTSLFSLSSLWSQGRKIFNIIFLGVDSATTEDNSVWKWLTSSLDHLTFCKDFLGHFTSMESWSSPTSLRKEGLIRLIYKRGAENNVYSEQTSPQTYQRYRRLLLPLLVILYPVQIVFVMQQPYWQTMEKAYKKQQIWIKCSLLK